MAWYRFAFLALLLHLAVLFLFTFTFKGTRDTYKIDLIFWGSILRPQEVSSQDRRLSQKSADVKDVDVASGPRTRLLLWSRGISIDKPDFFRNPAVVVNEDTFRFAGKRVDLDEQEAPSLREQNDMPQPAPVKMRWERP